jgi:hypothetical protein
MCRHYIAVNQKILNHLILKDRFVGGVSYSPPSVIKFVTHFVTTLSCLENENDMFATNKRPLAENVQKFSDSKQSDLHKM